MKRNEIIEKEFNPWLIKNFNASQIESIYLMLGMAYEMGARDQIKIEMERMNKAFNE